MQASADGKSIWQAAALNADSSSLNPPPPETCHLP